MSTHLPTAPKHAPHARRAPFALLVVGLIVGGMFTLLALNTASAANEVRRHDIAAQDQSVAAQLVQLQNDVRASAGPGNLAAAAAALGMVPAGDPAFLEIGSDGKVRVLGSPAPASAAPVYVPTPTSSKSKAKATPTATGTKTDAKSAATSTHPGQTPSTQTQSTQTASTQTATTRHSASPTKKATPAPTPTPTVSLPGGNR